ncbi:MAG: helix-turn-helix domain-containing protein [Kangiellaceae bacterium]|nr:helix-turn-helix domain-containing protein [Kangiellaceae bacterium]
MNSSIYMVYSMPFAERLTNLRKQKNLTQEALGNQVGLTKAQIYRYEKGNSQPTLHAIKKLALALCVTSDELIFEDGERQPDQELLFLFEGVTRLDPDEKRLIKELIEGVMLKHDARRYVNRAS